MTDIKLMRCFVCGSQTTVPIDTDEELFKCRRKCETPIQEVEFNKPDNVDEVDPNNIDEVDPSNIDEELLEELTDHDLEDTLDA